MLFPSRKSSELRLGGADVSEYIASVIHLTTGGVHDVLLLLTAANVDVPVGTRTGISKLVLAELVDSSPALFELLCELFPVNGVCGRERSREERAEFGLLPPKSDPSLSWIDVLASWSLLGVVSDPDGPDMPLPQNSR